ncbi:MAG TPA: hypothetical protein VG713_17115 [Pirellulales bacterium]|nr:hypothetical protein [Pirellulales bacterium]
MQTVERSAVLLRANRNLPDERVLETLVEIEAAGATSVSLAFDLER